MLAGAIFCALSGSIIFLVINPTVGIKVIENIIAESVAYCQAAAADRSDCAFAAGGRSCPVLAGRFIVVNFF